VAEYMLIHGHKKNPMITGASVHNQRVERLWRDTYRCVLSVFYQIFYHLEENGFLDPTSELDLFCLHFVYMQKINDALKTFMAGWNNHALTTESNKTPIQLYTCGVLFGNTDSSPIPSDFSVDSEHLDFPNVMVPDTIDPLSPQQYAELNTLLCGHTVDSDSTDDYDIDSYLQVRRFVHRHCNQ